MKKTLTSMTLCFLLLFAMLASTFAVSAADPVKVALIGDHFAVGNSDGAFLGLGTPIADALGEGYEVKTFGGNDFSSTAFSFDSSYDNSKTYAPDYVVIALGTKDCQVTDVNAAWDEYVANIQEFTEAYHELGAKIILLTPTKALNDLSGVGIDWTGNSGIFADKIKANQSTLGVDVIVDVYTASIDNDLYLCYINEAACTAVAAEIRSAILTLSGAGEEDSGTESGTESSPSTSDAGISMAVAAVAVAAAVTVVAVRKKEK